MTNPNLRELLARFDEPGAYEFPSSFDYQKLEARAKLVAADLVKLGMQIDFEDAGFNQDASFSIAILLRDFEKASPQGTVIPTIRFSNFGNLTSLCSAEMVLRDRSKSIEEILAKHGFTFIPAQALEAAYDGVMSDKVTFPSWWVRYFDWV